MVKYTARESRISTVSLHLAQTAAETRSSPVPLGYWRAGSDALPDWFSRPLFCPPQWVPPSRGWVCTAQVSHWKTWLQCTLLHSCTPLSAGEQDSHCTCEVIFVRVPQLTWRAGFKGVLFWEFTPCNFCHHFVKNNTLFWYLIQIYSNGRRKCIQIYLYW